MQYTMTKPCSNCPFRRGTPMKLHPGRIDEITDSVLHSRGAEFPCHKTVTDRYCDEDGNTVTYQAGQHCAGAILFALKYDNMTQMMRIAHRLGMFNPKQFTDSEAVFDSVEEMKEAISYTFEDAPVAT